MKHRFGMATVRRFHSVTNASTHRWRQELSLMAAMVGHPMARNAGRCDGSAWALQSKIASRQRGLDLGDLSAFRKWRPRACVTQHRLTRVSHGSCRSFQSLSNMTNASSVQCSSQDISIVRKCTVPAISVSQKHPIPLTPNRSKSGYNKPSTEPCVQ
jgi:hypothetical protein